MTNSHKLKYPVQIRNEANNEYSVQAIDYPCCKATSNTLIEATNLVRGQLEEITWKDSQNSCLIEPSALDIKLTNSTKSIITEIEIVKRYNEPPKTLYYYQEFSDIAIKMLTNPYIWFSDPKHFNDPFELPDVLEPSWNSSEEWREFTHVYKHHKDTLDIFRRFTNREDAFCYLKLHDQTYLNKLLAMTTSAVDSTFSKTRAACFSRNFDSILMWSHYSKKHSGIVIGYDHKSILNQCSILMGSDIDYRHHPEKLLSGNYAGGFDGIIKSEYASRKLFTKHPSWSYEQEYRLINGNGIDKCDIDINSITELYFGCNIDEGIRKALIAITNKSNIKLYDMVKHNVNDLKREAYKKTR